MRAAIDDGLRAAARADVRAASPFRRPRDLRAFAAFAAVGAVISLLSFGPEPSSAKLAAVSRSLIRTATSSPSGNSSAGRARSTSTART